MLMQYIPPSRWWRREIKVGITVWPQWLAQLLCPHGKTRPIMWQGDENDASKCQTMVQCNDCYRRWWEGNPCKHEKRTASGSEFVYTGGTFTDGTPKGEWVDRQWTCDDCGLPIYDRKGEGPMQGAPGMESK